MAKNKKHTPESLKTDMAEIRQEFSGASDRAAAIIAASFLDLLLINLLKSFLTEATEQENSRIFEGNGPISSFSSRIEICYRLGLISSIERKKLHVIRDIRNDFAHQLGGMSFHTQSIKDKCKGIEFPVEMVSPAEIDIDTQNCVQEEIFKAESSNPRAVFQEAVYVLINIICGRKAFFSLKKLQSPEEYVSADEPAVDILEAQKTIESFYIFRLQQTPIEDKERSRIKNEIYKIRRAISIQEGCIRKLKDAKLVSKDK